MIGTGWRDIDNPAMEALPLGMGIGEIVEGRAFLGYQFYRHDPILAACSLLITNEKLQIIKIAVAPPPLKIRGGRGVMKKRSLILRVDNKK